MTQAAPPVVVAYPPAPWHLRGQAWVGLFKSDTVTALPAGLRPLFSRRWRVVILARYTGGTLRYDELIVAAPACQGTRIGLYIEYIWVTDEASLWAGRHIWGLPKELASFSWESNRVSVADNAGAIAALTVDHNTSRPLPIWLPAPSFGRQNSRWLHTLLHLRGRFGRAGMQLTVLSKRFPYRLGKRPLVAGSVAQLHLIVPPPKYLAA